MFGPVDETLDHTIITVSKPVKIMPLRRAVLTPGTYKIAGDIRSRLGHVSVRRLMAAGFFSIEFVKSAENVSARKQYEVQSEVADENGHADVSIKPDTNLPGVDAMLREPQEPTVEEPVAEEVSQEIPQPQRRRRVENDETTQVVTPTPIEPDAVASHPDVASTERAEAPAVSFIAATDESSSEEAAVADTSPEEQSIELSPTDETEEQAATEPVDVEEPAEEPIDTPVEETVEAGEQDTAEETGEEKPAKRRRRRRSS